MRVRVIDALRVQTDEFEEFQRPLFDRRPVALPPAPPVALAVCVLEAVLPCGAVGAGWLVPIGAVVSAGLAVSACAGAAASAGTSSSKAAAAIARTIHVPGETDADTRLDLRVSETSHSDAPASIEYASMFRGRGF